MIKINDNEKAFCNKNEISEIPEMIMFDYGHTLLQEPGWNPRNGINALMQYVIHNPNGYTTDDIMPYVDKLIKNDLPEIKRRGYDVTWKSTARFLSELLSIKLSVNSDTAEIIFWNGETPGETMPYADIMLSELKRLGIRTAVVSNLTMSCSALKERLNRLIPDNNIEFVITSSDYVFRKPNPLIFRLALNKAKLPPEKVWFCGDNPCADIEGASNAGIFPVWYDSEIECPYRDKEREIVPSCRHLHIKNWNELILILKNQNL